MAKKRRQPTRRKPVWYPEVANCIHEGLGSIRDYSKNVTQKDVAEDCGVAAGVFSQMLNGLQIPTPQQWVIFSRLFAERAHPGKEKDQVNKRRALQEKLLVAPTIIKPRADTLRKQLAEGATLKFTSINYEPFAGSEKCFFEAVFSRFFGVAGIKNLKLDNRQSFEPEEYEESDVTLALFDSADRMLNLGLKFWRVPIRIGLGAVCLHKHRGEVQSISRILANLEKNKGKRVRVIVARGEVGSLHCRKRLQMIEGEDGDLLEISTLNVDALKEELLAQSKICPDKIHVVCTDEYTSLKLLSSLGKEGYPIFPMNSRKASQDKQERRELPQYYCSIAIKRDDPDFYDFMQDALVQFLSTEIETTAESLFTLAKELVRKLVSLSLEGDGQKAKRWRAALEWVFFTLSLDRDSIDSYTTSHNLPWKPILTRARQRFQKYLASEAQLEMQVISSLVGLFWDEQIGAIKSYGIDQLCHIFDLPLSDLGSEMRSPETPGILVDSLRKALMGAEPNLDIDVQPYDPLDVTSPSAQRAKRSAVQFMRSLQNMYYLRECDSAVAILQTKIDELDPPNDPSEHTNPVDKRESGMGIGTTPFGGESGRILLARVSGEQDPIGGACLSSLDCNRCCLSYLWVEPHYRDRRVGERIIKQAIIEAKRFNCAIIYAEVLKEVLPSAASLFTQTGFTEVTILETGRTVFERHLG